MASTGLCQKHSCPGGQPFASTQLAPTKGRVVTQRCLPGNPSAQTKTSAGPESSAQKSIGEQGRSSVQILKPAPVSTHSPISGGGGHRRLRFVPAQRSRVCERGSPERPVRV